MSTVIPPKGEQTSNPSTQRHLTQVDLASRSRLSPPILGLWRWLKGSPQFLKDGGKVCYRVEAFEAAPLHGCK